MLLKVWANFSPDSIWGPVYRAWRSFCLSWRVFGWSLSSWSCYLESLLSSTAPLIGSSNECTDFLAEPYSISSPVFFFIFFCALTFFLPTIELGSLQPLSKHLRKSFKHIIPTSLAFVLIIFNIMVKQSAEPTPIYQGTLNWKEDNVVSEKIWTTPIAANYWKKMRIWV